MDSRKITRRQVLEMSNAYMETRDPKEQDIDWAIGFAGGLRLLATGGVDSSLDFIQQTVESLRSLSRDIHDREVYGVSMAWFIAHELQRQSC
jgi:hypothetical protein